MSLLNKNLLWITIIMSGGNLKAMSRFSRFFCSAQAVSRSILSSQAGKTSFKLDTKGFNTTKNMSIAREAVARARNIGSFATPHRLGIAAAGVATGTGLYIWYQQANLPQNKIEEYTVNLMWINKHLQENQKYIYPSASEESIHNDLLQHIFKWAYITQDGAIVFWYDSAVTPAQAIQNTQTLISDYSKKNPTCAAIRLQDIRSLQYVKQYPEVFSDKTPVYFRVDLLKAVASLETVEKEGALHFILADLDMDPLNKEQLFDQETVASLNTHGTVMATQEVSKAIRDASEYARANGMSMGFTPYENGFFILTNKNKHLLRAMHEILVKSNIRLATDILRNPKSDFCGSRMVYLPEAVYKSYLPMFAYYDHLQNNASKEPSREEEIFVPIKHVSLPPAQGNYYEDIKKA